MPPPPDSVKRGIAKSIRGGRIDSDGLVSEIYNLVWNKSLHTSGGCGMRIPETVILEQGFPRVWYSWSTDVQEMEKKLGKDIVLSRLHAQWAKSAKSPQDVVAEFLSQHVDPATGSNVLSIEYYDSEDLLRFVQTRAHGVSGLLQQFVVPKPNYNLVVQATWSPHAMLCTSRRNKHPLSHTWISPPERCCSFDGPPSLSESTPVSPFVRQKVGKELEAFAKHVEEHQRAAITGMVCFVKFDVEGHLHLLQCTSIRTAREAGAPPAPPLDLGVRYDTATRQQEKDTIVLRCDKGGLPELNLANITDEALSALRIDTADMLFFPNHAQQGGTRRGRGQQGRRGDRSPPKRAVRAPQPPMPIPRLDVILADVPSSKSKGGANPFNVDQFHTTGQVVDKRFGDRTGHRVSIGVPDIAKQYPQEFSELESFLGDVIYRCHWHFYDDVRCGERRAGPYEFIVPQKILAILGYEGVQVFMQRFHADDAGHISTKDNNGEISQQMRLRIVEPHAAHLGLDRVKAFIVDRLECGLPRYEGGIDWTRVREKRGPRRSTHWMRLVGASESALKNREALKKLQMESHSTPAEVPGLPRNTQSWDRLSRESPQNLIPVSPRKMAVLTPEMDKDDDDDENDNDNDIDQDNDGARVRSVTSVVPAVVAPVAPPVVSPRFTKFLKKGGSDARKLARHPSQGWKLVASFPEPPAVSPRVLFRPRKKAVRNTPRRRTYAYRSQQEQLEFWCQSGM